MCEKYFANVRVLMWTIQMELIQTEEATVEVSARKKNTTLTCVPHMNSSKIIFYKSWTAWYPNHESFVSRSEEVHCEMGEKSSTFIRPYNNRSQSGKMDDVLNEMKCANQKRLYREKKTWCAVESLFFFFFKLE